METLNSIRWICYQILREEEDSYAYPYTLMNSMINSVQLKVCNWEVVNPLSKEVVVKGQLPFLNKEIFYSNIADTSLTADVLSTDTVINVWDTTNYDDAWQIDVYWNTITYTWKTSLTFTWCSGILSNFKSGTKVKPVFLLPDNFGSAKNVIYNNTERMSSKWYDEIFNDSILEKYYTIKDNKYIIFWQVSNNTWIFKLRYDCMPEEMTDITDEVIIDNDIYAKNVLPYLAVWELLYNRGEEQRAAELINFWMWQLKEMYSFYNKTNYESLNNTKYKMWWNKFNI